MKSQNIWHVVDSAKYGPLYYDTRDNIPITFCGLSTHSKTHTQTMAYCPHHTPLSSCSMSGHVLCAIPIPIAIVATVACPPAS